MRSAFALRIISGKIILNFGVQKRLRAFLNPIFTDEVVKENGICSACFLRKRGAAGERLLPWGELSSVARLRGYKWRSEKSVKALAPTGAALAFLCFDFFFRIVKGE